GRFCSMESEICVFDEELLMSTTGDSPVTWTVSVTDATDSVTSMVTVTPSGRMTSSRFTVLKPASVLSMVYTPGCSAGKRYMPCESVRLVWTPPTCDGLATLTVTPGSTAPVLSLTVPASADV